MQRLKNSLSRLNWPWRFRQDACYSRRRRQQAGLRTGWPRSRVRSFRGQSNGGRALVRSRRS